MVHYALTFTLSLLTSLELALIILSFLVWLTKQGFNIAEGFGFSCLLTLVACSLAIQFFLVVGRIQYFPILEIPCLLYLIRYLIKNRATLGEAAGRTWQTVRQGRAIGLLLGVVCLYELAQSFLLPPLMVDVIKDHLPRVYMAINENTLFLKNYTSLHHVSDPWAFDILPYLFLRFNSDFGMGIFSWIGYVAMLACTFGLVDRVFRSKPLSALTTLVIASLWETVYETNLVKADVLVTALTVASFLALFRYLSRRDFTGIEPILIGIFLVFGVQCKGYYPVLVLAFLVVTVPFTIHRLRHDEESWRWSAGVSKLALPLGLLAGVALTLALAWGSNLYRFGNVTGPAQLGNMMRNKDGLPAAFVNFLRYMVDSLELPRDWGGAWLTDLHDRLLGAHKYIGTDHFHVENTITLWHRRVFDYYVGFGFFGPLGWMLATPAIFIAAMRARGMVRALSLTLSLFLALFCYLIVFSTEGTNGRYLCIFFAGSGLCIAWLIQKYLNRFSMRFLIGLLASFSLIYAVLFAFQRSISEPYPGAWLYYVVDRDLNYSWWGNRFNSVGVHVVNTFVHRVEPGKRVLIVTDSNGVVLPYYLKRPDLKIVTANATNIVIGPKHYNLFKYDDAEGIIPNFDYIYCINYPENSMDQVETIEWLKKDLVYRLRPIKEHRPNNFFSLYKLQGPPEVK